MKVKNGQKDDHPDRNAMLRALVEDEIPFREHLKICDSCRTVFEWLRLSRQMKALELATPSPSTYLRHGNLPLFASDWVPRRSLAGQSVYDSWTHLPATITRDSAMGLARNLRYTAGEVTLELVADRTPEGWHFAARCYRGASPSAEFVLQVGKRRMQPGLQYCYAWTAPRPPRRIQLLSPSLKLVVETGL